MNPFAPANCPGSRWLIICLLLNLGVTLGASAADHSEVFYDPQTVQTIHLSILPDDLQRMQRALPQRISVPGSFRWNDQQLENVAIRYKGNSSSAPDSPHKRSFLVEFSEFKSGQRFLGLRNVALDNGIQFGSLFSERLVTDALRGVGVKASRCNYARLFLNQTNLGVYVNVERIDKSFLARNFTADKGPLFKVDEGGPGADLRYLGSELAPYRKTFELHSGKEKEAYPHLLDFIRAVDRPDGTESDLARVLDVDAFLKTTAVLLFAGAFDQYTGWGPHNYYLYQNPLDERWTYIPWDLDVAFADKAFGQIPVLEGWNAAWPAPVPGRPLMERLVTETNLLQRYRNLAGPILETWFRPDVLVPKLRGLHAQIRADLATDPYPARRATVPSDRNYEDILASMEVFIRERYASARTQLDQPGTRPPQRMPMPPHSAQPQGPSPGSASPDSPVGLSAIAVSSSRVELGWTARSRGEMAFVVQRSTGPDGSDFVNVVGQPAERGCIAVDTQIRAGETYRYRVFAVLPSPQGPRGTGVSNVITVEVPEN